ncbi:MAG: creatininase family protein [Deltaproteobacteria bacterium]
MSLLDEPTATHDTRSTWRDAPIDLGDLTTVECALVLAGPHPVVIVPIGSTEPHGPHLPLATDALLALESARRAARALREQNLAAVAAPPIPYGVTRYAAGFAGAISLSPGLVEQLLFELCVAYRAAGFCLVCVVNHHLEPENVSAIARSVAGANGEVGRVVFANQLTPRWGRTLSAEFKRGNCHGGSYETSLLLAGSASLVHEDVRTTLPSVPISLSTAIRAGQRTFHEMGIDRAYTGSPAEATVAEGDALYEQLTTMVVSEVTEALGLAKRP